MDIGAVESGPAELAFAPWKRGNKLPPLDWQVLVGQQAQLMRLQELTQADGRTVLTLWGAAGMVSVASLGTCDSACHPAVVRAHKTWHSELQPLGNKHMCHALLYLQSEGPALYNHPAC